jgi:hypothetical protein
MSSTPISERDIDHVMRLCETREYLRLGDTVTIFIADPDMITDNELIIVMSESDPMYMGAGLYTLSFRLDMDHPIVKDIIAMELL